MVFRFVTIATRLGAENGVPAPLTIDGPQGRDWLVQPCASATSSPGGLVRLSASRCSSNRASVDSSSRGRVRLSDRAPGTIDWWSRAGFGTREVAPDEPPSRLMAGARGQSSQTTARGVSVSAG